MFITKRDMVTVQMVGKYYEVRANEGLCYRETSYSVAAFKASNLAKDLKWNIFFVK